MTSTSATSGTSTSSYSVMDRLIKPLIYLFAFLFCSISIGLIVGEEAERRAWHVAPSTLPLYSTDAVCRHDETGNILNCGQCGHCSNLHDIKIYHETRSTLTGIMTKCAFQDLMFDNDAFDCLVEEAGMTEQCSKCWVQNYHCNKDNCMRTCLKHRKFPFLPSWRPWNSEPLDPCIACDEKFCGPEFVACAGANRRRVGVVSDIERDMEREVCDKVDWEWVLTHPTSTTCGSTFEEGKGEEAEETPAAEIEEQEEEEEEIPISESDSIQPEDEQESVDEVEATNEEVPNTSADEEEDTQTEEEDNIEEELTDASTEQEEVIEETTPEIPNSFVPPQGDADNDEKTNDEAPEEATEKVETEPEPTTSTEEEL